MKRSKAENRRHRKRAIHNARRRIEHRLRDIEWNPEPGRVLACGGDSLMRVKAFEQAGRFDPTMIAGEEPELSVRMRKNGWQLECLDVPMTIHDAGMTRFSQWWRRSERAGHAYAEGNSKHGSKPWRHNVRPVRRILIWGIALWLLHRGVKPGNLFASVVALLATERFFVELVRAKDDRFFGDFTLAQLISVLIILIAVVAIRRRRGLAPAPSG